MLRVCTVWERGLGEVMCKIPSSLLALEHSKIKSHLLYFRQDFSVFVYFIYISSAPTLHFSCHFSYYCYQSQYLSCISLIPCALKSLQNEILLFLCSYLPRLNIPICHPSKFSTFCCQQSACPFRPSVPEGFSLWPDPIFCSANQQHAAHLPSRNQKIWSCNFCRYFFIPSSGSRLEKNKYNKLNFLKIFSSD